MVYIICYSILMVFGILHEYIFTDNQDIWKCNSMYPFAILIWDTQLKKKYPVKGMAYILSPT